MLDRQTRTSRAVEFRDLALRIVEARGGWMDTRSGPKLLSFSDSDLQISHRGLFQTLPPLNGELIRKWVAHGMMPPRTLPHRLDIWHIRKVLNVEWVRLRGHLLGQLQRRRLGGASRTACGGA
jgi:hypothetical protein